jgi:Type I phosphodiesterase / nucleotide pyrophosphatase
VPDQRPEQAAADLLAQCELDVPGLYRRHCERNLSAIATHISAAFNGGGQVRLGSRRRLVVIAVDGLGFALAARTMEPAVLTPLTSEFPTTTVPCMLASLTGQPPDTHGFIGVQYLHEDGLHAVNCHDGQLFPPGGPAPDGQPAPAPPPARPTVTPAFPTVFDGAARAAVRTVAVPGELATLHKDIRARMLHGAETIVAAPACDLPGEPASGSPDEAAAGLLARAEAFGTVLTTGAAALPATLTWAYFDLDTHIHRYGFGPAVDAAAAALGRLAARLSEDGAAVLIYSDHGLTESRPSADTIRVWQEASSARYCRLPGGGAGRARWLYPHAGQAERVASMLSAALPDAVVTTQEQAAGWGLVRPGSIGQQRLGEVLLLATGPDFPVPDTSTAFEHGSMTASELLVPLAIWHPAD